MPVVRIEPLTRVEGAGRVELQIAPDGFLYGVHLELVESYRLFEGLVLGRFWYEIPGLVCRICAICSGVHRIAAAAALERALAVEVPPAAQLLRELLLLGGTIESHALHLFCLVLPDLAGTPSVLELLKERNVTAQQGLELKRLGNRLQEVAGGRAIHPVNVEVGGCVAFPERAALQSLAVELEAWTRKVAEILGPYFEAGAFPPGSEAIGLPLAVTSGRGYSLMGERLALAQGRSIAGENYRELLGERPVVESNAKRSEGSAGPFLVGALARLRLHHERSGEEWALVPPEAGIHGNNLAQARELIWALDRSREVVEKLLDAPVGTPLRSQPVAVAGNGTAVIEAPRGTLIHHYVLDDLGRVALADIVTPTAINQVSMERQLFADLQELRGEAHLKERAERIVRAYDPCISCSVHVLRA